jgi:sugar phosphate isomerase/epimerase
MTRIGLSTTLFGDMRLGAREFDLLAAHGFALVELAAGPGRFDIRDPAQVDETRARLAAAGLELGGVSVALADASLAMHGIVELGGTLLVARAGVCGAHGPVARQAPLDIHALRRGIEHVAEHGAERGIALAIEFPADLAPDVQVALIEAFEDGPVGVCLDVGHAHVGGDAPEAIEILSGHILTTHLSDNHAQDDAHRAPGSGSVDWPAVLTELWKTGYAGPAIIELAADQDAPAALTRAVGARTRLQAILDDLAQPMVFPE